jgi:hypothetical protein
MKWLYPFILIITVGFNPAWAQRNSPLRVELNANLEMEDYNLVPCGEKGVLVFFESEEKGSEPETHTWHFAFYDNNFSQKWLADTALISGVKFMAHHYEDGETYLVFHDAGKQRSSYNIQILKVDYDQHHFRIINALVQDRSELVHFSIAGDRAVAAFNNTTYEPFLAFISLADGAVNQVKPEIEGLNIIQQVHHDVDSENLLVVIENYLGKKQNTIMMLEFGAGGDLKKTYRLNPALGSKVINSARIADSAGDTILIMGTYSNYSSRLAEKNDESGPETAGYFISMFIADREVFINYYNFLEFKEMYRAMSSKTLADIRRNAEKKKSRGEEYSLDYTLLLHDVIPFGNNYVLLAEAYYPEYRTETNMYYDYYGRPIPQTYTVFDGYHYISGIAAAFTADGALSWDDGIEIRDILTFNLNKYIASHVGGNELALFYISGNQLYYKITGASENESTLQNITIESKYKGDKVMEDLGSKVIHWYGNYFICYGYQKIKNNRIAEGKRTVFYFNKLAFN